MKATKEILAQWLPYIDSGTATNIRRKTKLSYPTIHKCLMGENVKTDNFIKIHGYFVGLKKKLKRLNKSMNEL